MTVHLDTLAIAGKLKAAGFSEAQAEAMTIILRDAREAEWSQLATKPDLEAFQQATKAAIDGLRRDVDNKLSELELRLIAPIEVGKAETIKWVISAIGFQTLVVVAAIVALSRSFQP